MFFFHEQSVFSLNYVCVRIFVPDETRWKLSQVRCAGSHVPGQAPVRWSLQTLPAVSAWPWCPSTAWSSASWRPLGYTPTPVEFHASNEQLYTTVPFNLKLCWRTIKHPDQNDRTSNEFDCVWMSWEISELENQRMSDIVERICKVSERRCTLGRSGHDEWRTAYPDHGPKGKKFPLEVLSFIRV